MQGNKRFFWCLIGLEMQLCLITFPSLGLYKRILNSPGFVILLIHTKHETIRWNLGLNPRFYSLERKLTQYVDKAKNMWLIVGQLPIKAGWWDAPLALWDFSWSNKQSYFFFSFLYLSLTIYSHMLYITIIYIHTYQLVLYSIFIKKG